MLGITAYLIKWRKKEKNLPYRRMLKGLAFDPYFEVVYICFETNPFPELVVIFSDYSLRT